MKSYGLKNYKLIESGNFELNKINIIIGENSSGKSSLLRSFQLIKQSLPFSLKNLHTNSKDGIDFGTYSNLISSKKEKQLSFSISFNRGEGKNEYGNFKISELQLTYQENVLEGIKIFLNNNLYVLSLQLDNNKIQKVEFNDKDLIENFEDEIFIKYSKELCMPQISITSKLPKLSKFSENAEIEIVSLIIDFITEEIYLDENLELTINEKEKNIDFNKKENKLILETIKTEAIKSMVNKLLEEAGEKLKRVFNNIVYIGPIRAIGERYYRIIEENLDRKDIVNNDVSRKLYELKVNKNLESFNKFISQYFDFKVDVNSISSNTNEDIFFSIEIEKDGDKKNLLDVGAGYSQLLPILYSCFGKEKDFPAIIIVEQPELHLHPKMQCDLIDFILKLCNKNKKIEFILETHSSLLINRLGKHILKRNFNSDDINLFIFNKSKKLDIRKTGFDKDGTITEWPIRFFSEKELREWS